MAQDGNARPAFKYFHGSGVITAQQVKPTVGTLRSVTLNTTGATPGVLTIADNTVPNTSNPIAVITPVANSTVNSCLIFDVAFNSGLVINNTTAANTLDFTVGYI